MAASSSTITMERWPWREPPRLRGGSDLPVEITTPSVLPQSGHWRNSMRRSPATWTPMYSARVRKAGSTLSASCCSLVHAARTSDMTYLIRTARIPSTQDGAHPVHMSARGDSVLRDQRQGLGAGAADDVHQVHRDGIGCVVVDVEQNHPVVLARERGVHLGDQLLLGDRLVIQENHPAAVAHHERAGSGRGSLLRARHGRGELSDDHGRGHHENDEQDEHDIDERRDIDLGSALLRSTKVHRHEVLPAGLEGYHGSRRQLVRQRTRLTAGSIDPRWFFEPWRSTVKMAVYSSRGNNAGFGRSHRHPRSGRPTRLPARCHLGPVRIAARFAWRELRGANRLPRRSDGAHEPIPRARDGQEDAGSPARGLRRGDGDRVRELRISDDQGSLATARSRAGRVLFDW